jgi:hypothetical protein
VIFFSLPDWGQNKDKKPAPKLPVKVEAAPVKPARKGLGIGLRLYGGLGYITGGDVNPGLSGSLDLWQAVIFPPDTIKTGGYKPLHAGINGGCDILLYLQSHWGIALGIDYLKIARTSETKFSDPGGDGYIVFSYLPNVSAIPLKLGLFFDKPLGRKVNLFLHGGGAYYPVRFHYELRMASPDGWSTLTAETTAGCVGFQVGAALEISLSKKLFFFIEAIGRYARVDGFSGMAIDEYSDEPSESNSVTIYFVNANAPEGRFPMLFPMKEFPDDPKYSDVREAVVDFSGFSARAGLRIKF